MVSEALLAQSLLNINSFVCKCSDDRDLETDFWLCLDFFSEFRVDNIKTVRGSYTFPPLMCQERNYLGGSLQNCDKIIKLQNDPLCIQKHISKLTILDRFFTGTSIWRKSL